MCFYLYRPIYSATSTLSFVAFAALVDEVAATVAFIRIFQISRSLYSQYLLSLLPVHGVSVSRYNARLVRGLRSDAHSLRRGLVLPTASDPECSTAQSG